MNTVLDDILNQAGRSINYDDDEHIVNGHSFPCTIEVDDILAAYGSTLIAKDIFDQLRDLSVIYSTLVHPTISEIYNGVEDRSRLNNIRKDDELANNIYNSLEAKIYLHIESIQHKVGITVEVDDVIELCVTIIEMLITHVRALVEDELHKTPKGEVPASLYIVERAKSTLIPNARDPRLLEIVLEHYWVYE